MTDSPLVLGIDLGTSGIRTAVVAANGAVLDSRSQAYGGAFANPHSWHEGCGNLIRAIPAQLRSQLKALAVDGTSGTLLACARAPYNHHSWGAHPACQPPRVWGQEWFRTMIALKRPLMA